MENASKALIIAGAILVAILLISVGIIVQVIYAWLQQKNTNYNIKTVKYKVK